MRLFRNISVQRKQTLVIMLTTSVALLLICAGLTVFQVVTFRREMVEHLTTYGNIVGNNVSAALDFNDVKAAEDVLAGLKAEPNVIGARLYAKDGTVFAEYKRDGIGAAFTPPQKVRMEGHDFSKDSLSVFQPIKSGNETLGTLFIQSDTHELSTQLGQYFTIIAGAFGIT